MFKFTLLISLFLYLPACGGGDQDEYIDSAPIADKMMARAAGYEEVATTQIVRNGSVDFESEDLEEDYIKVTDIIKRFEGSIIHENQYRSDRELQYNITVKVQANRFDSLLNQILELPVKINSKNTNSEDVTERYYDLQTRLKNKQALEARYVDLLSQTKTIKDILEIENSLNNIRTEIERLQGQFNYLQDQVSYSQLNITFSEKIPESLGQLDGFPRRVLNSLILGWGLLIDFTLTIIRLWPFTILIIVFIAWRRRVKKRRQQMK